MEKIGNYRARFINYCKPGIFMITMNKRNGLQDFSQIIRNPFERDPIKSCHPAYSNLGFSIYHYIKNFKEITSDIKILQYIIMPDHIHILIEIVKELPNHLSFYIDIFNANIANKLHAEGVIPSKISSIFEKGYNDQFLKHGRSLNKIFTYIKENPYWLWIRKENPQFFEKNKILIEGRNCSIYGNRLLLSHPFIYPVVVHRSDFNNKKILDKKREIWKYAMNNGGILMGAFINREEKRILNEAFEAGAKVIYLRNERFGEREKPGKSLLEFCSKGNLLLVSPDMDEAAVLAKRDPEKWFGRKHEFEIWGFREDCLYLNNLAETYGKGDLRII